MNIPQFDLFITEKIQSIGEYYLPLMKSASFLGRPDVYFGIILIAFFVNKDHGIRQAILYLLGGSIQIIGKLLLKQPRPYLVSDSIIARASAHGYGLPSGHALIPAVFWTYLILCTKHPAFKIIGISLCFLIGISRVYLGVHSFFQVLAGWVLGVSLAVGLFLFEKNRDSSKKY